LSFIIIGENVHTTRIVRRRDARVGLDESGREAIAFVDADGEQRWLPVSSAEQATMEYEEGRIKHVRNALRMAMAEADDADVALAYLHAIARSQVEAGAAFLDVNVDEVSIKLADQTAAMRWLVGAISPAVPVPLSIDSSNLEIIEAGIEAADRHAGAPMLNSASLERLEALDLAVATGGPVIITAAGSSGMPSGADERVGFVAQMVAHAEDRGIEHDRLFIDPLVFPISVDGEFGHHCLDAIRTIRSRWPDAHITGGMSNVSFGLPNRRLINDAFLVMAIEAGADSGIIDPILNPPARALAADRSSPAFALAFDVLTGADRSCKVFLRASRSGALTEAAA
jgi:5-methyltetrahydrofolate--homocysteine methyltransferase